MPILLLLYILFIIYETIDNYGVEKLISAVMKISQNIYLNIPSSMNCQDR